MSSNTLPACITIPLEAILPPPVSLRENKLYYVPWLDFCKYAHKKVELALAQAIVKRRPRIYVCALHERVYEQR